MNNSSNSILIKLFASATSALSLASSSSTNSANKSEVTGEKLTHESSSN